MEVEFLGCQGMVVVAPNADILVYLLPKEGAVLEARKLFKVWMKEHTCKIVKTAR